MEAPRPHQPLTTSLNPHPPKHFSIHHQSMGPTMANSCPQRAGPGPWAMVAGGWGGRGPGPGPSPWTLAWARPSVEKNWPWSYLLTDVVLTSAGGLGVKGRGEGVVWVGEPLCPSVVASGGSTKIEGLGFVKPL